MPDYAALNDVPDKAVRARIVDGLQRLRHGLHEQIPGRTAADTLLLATWNIREFDSGKYGYRPDEAYYYIGEIISRFDLVAVQEVRDGLYPLQQLQRVLGSWWDFVVTDVTLGRAGNAERMAYLYDRRKVAFTGLAAELGLPPDAKGGAVQFARAPYVVGFRAGWANFTLVTVHIYYGEGVAVDKKRLAEITALGGLLAKNAVKFSAAPQQAPGRKPDPGNLIVLGDFNIFNRDDVTLKALTESGFVVPEALQAIPGSNVAQDKHYDQIAYLDRLTRMAPTGRAGVFDYYEHVYRDADEAAHQAERAVKPGQSYRDWRTYRMSDHLPMWIEFGIDDTDAYLAGG